MYDSKGKGFYMKPIIYGATMDDFFKGRWEWTDGGLGGTRFAILETIREFYRSSGKDIPIYIEYRHSHIKGFPMLEKLIEMGEVDVIIMPEPTYFSHSKQLAFDVYRNCINSGVEILFIDIRWGADSLTAIYNGYPLFGASLNRVPRKYSTCDMDFNPLKKEINCKKTTVAPDDFFMYSMGNTRSLSDSQKRSYWLIETGQSTEKKELEVAALSPLTKISKNTFRKRIAVYESSDQYIDDLVKKVYEENTGIENMPKAFGEVPDNVIEAYEKYISKGLKVPQKLTELPNPIDYKRYLLKYQRKLKNAKLVALQKRRYHDKKNKD